MGNQFHNKDGEQNIGQGEGSIAKQVNDNSATTQTLDGDNNIFSGTGDVHVEEHHHAAPASSAEVSGSGAVAQNGATAAGADGMAIGGNVHGNIYVNSGPTAPSKPPHSLPPQDHIFLHRKEELTWLDQHLQPDQIVAICGPGGMGKSALAARAVRVLPADRFPDGIVFHTYYHQAETAQALQSIARAFGLKAEADLEQEVALALSGKQALLILDGTEEAKDLQALLHLRGSCGMLITTRRKSDCGPLRLDLSPLPDEQAEEVLRAWGEVSGDAEIVEQICALLGGWPVALRLAGHYLHSTGEPAADYLRWLEEEPLKELALSETHQADNAALLLKRSVAQVGEDARLVLGLAGCLAFAPLGTAPMIALLKDDERRTRRAINELVNYGLLERREEGLHIGHALIHEYAARHLPLNREALERLASYYIDFCRTQTAAGVPGYVCLDGERAHYLRLIRICLDNELWLEVKALVEAIWEYLDRQGWWTERVAAYGMRLIAAKKTGDRKDEALCLNNLGYDCKRRMEDKEALDYYEQSLLICQQLGNRKEEGTILNNIGQIYRVQRNHEQALEQFQQSLNIAREVGDRKGEGRVLDNIGKLYSYQEDYKQALQYYFQSLPIRQEAGDKRGEGTTLNNIAVIYRIQKKSSNALKYFEQALAIRRMVGNRAGEAVTCWNLGLTYEDLGDLAQAEEYINMAVQLMEPIKHPSLKRCRNDLKQVQAKRRGK